MAANIPTSPHPRVVIVGAGFGGLRLARKLSNKPFQIVLIDRNNFHQFQPLFYQVATSGLAPSSISFPVRKLFQSSKRVHFRMAEVESIAPEEKQIVTNIGKIEYDYLVLATGADTNYFNNEEIERHAFPMKSVQEALTLRNRVLECIESALVEEDPIKRQTLLNIVVVGGGPTGTEVSGALAEMKRYVLPKDYPELNFDEMQIHLLEASPNLLNGMSQNSSDASLSFLKKMGIHVQVNAFVESYDGITVSLKGGNRINCATLIWAAGVKGNTLEGLPDSIAVANNRIQSDQYSRVEQFEGVFVIGDLAIMESVNTPKGHPQVAQVAIQQADNLAFNLQNLVANKPLKSFKYKDLGSMATIGRNKAVVDLPYIKFTGFFAWIFWLFVHLMAILGVKNKLFIFFEWLWNYITFDQSLRLVIKQKPRTENSPGSENK